jgi:hypothetical protein
MVHQRGKIMGESQETGGTGDVLQNPVNNNAPGARVSPLLSEKTITWIGNQIGHHRRWRSIWSFVYFANAALIIIAGAATTAATGLFAMWSLPENVKLFWITLLAATTTILASLEKILRLREKWDLHRNIQVSLELIELKAAEGFLTKEKLLQEIDQTARLYSSQLSELVAVKTDLAKRE